MTTEGSNPSLNAIQAMIADLLKKQEETFLVAMNNQHQTIMDEVREMMNQTLNPTNTSPSRTPTNIAIPTVGTTMPAPQTSANLNLTPTNATIPTLNLDPLQEGGQTAPTERERN